MHAVSTAITGGSPSSSHLRQVRCVGGLPVSYAQGLAIDLRLVVHYHVGDPSKKLEECGTPEEAFYLCVCRVCSEPNHEGHNHGDNSCPLISHGEHSCARTATRREEANDLKECAVGECREEPKNGDADEKGGLAVHGGGTADVRRRWSQRQVSHEKTHDDEVNGGPEIESVLAAQLRIDLLVVFQLQHHHRQRGQIDRHA
mmetsp:Transcript_26721/g.51839  ORF Transcript_26721/g.51839 Transcript_26721/m.51839 type:complete len:201 (-) Transcript_26721:222-824(-)